MGALRGAREMACVVPSPCTCTLCPGPQWRGSQPACKEDLLAVVPSCRVG